MADLKGIYETALQEGKTFILTEEMINSGIKRIDKLNFYKNLSADDWENCIDGIIRKPQEVVRALMEYKYDSSVINSAISYGTNSEKTQSQIKAIESNNLL